MVLTLLHLCHTTISCIVYLLDRDWLQPHSIYICTLLWTLYIQFSSIHGSNEILVVWLVQCMTLDLGWYAKSAQVKSSMIGNWVKQPTFVVLYNIIRNYCIIIMIAYCLMWYCCMQKIVLLHLTHKHKYPYFLTYFQATVVSPILRLMPRCLFLVPLLVTQSLTTVPQGTSSLEAPAELVRIVGNGLALSHIVLVSYVCYY